MANSEELRARNAIATIVGIARAQLAMAGWDRPLDPAELLRALERIEEAGVEAMPWLRDVDRAL